jgi:RNA polymerase sigma factor (sigma-70 family)
VKIALAPRPDEDHPAAGVSPDTSAMRSTNPANNEQNDRERMLLDNVRAGSHEAFAELYRDNWRKGLMFATRQCRQSADAADVCASAFERILLALRNGRGPHTNFSAYLRTTINRIAIEQRVSVHNVILVSDVADEAYPIEVEPDSLANGHLSAAIGRMNPDHVKLLWLTEVVGFTASEVAARTGQSANSVSAQAYRARQQLRTHFHRQLADDLDNSGADRESADNGSDQRR